MEIRTVAGDRIDCLADWARLYSSPGSAHQWKERGHRLTLGDRTLLCLYETVLLERQVSA